MVPKWAGSYVGLQWESLGRGPKGFDCWGLCCHIVKEQYGWEWEDYMDAYSGRKMATAEDGLAAANASGVWKRLDTQEDDLNTRARDVLVGDVIHMKHAEHLVHVGLMLDTRHFIHVAVDQDSVIERIDNTVWRSRIQGFYRWTKR